MRQLCVFILLAFLAGACGQKGPLYLPKDDDNGKSSKSSKSSKNTSKKHEPSKNEEGEIVQ